MRQQAERLRQAPGREGIGAESGMHDGQPTGEVRLGQVGEVFPHLYGRQHSFVHDILARQGYDIEIFVMYAVLNPLPYYI